MKLRMTAIFLTLTFAAAAFAHGDKVHVTGTLEKVSADAVSVKTADGKIVDVKLAPTTVYIFRDGKSKEGSPAKASDLAVGQRVVIHATPKEKELIADEVKFAPPGSMPMKGSPAKPAGN